MLPPGYPWVPSKNVGQFGPGVWPALYLTYIWALYLTYIWASISYIYMSEDRLVQGTNARKVNCARVYSAYILNQFSLGG